MITLTKPEADEAGVDHDSLAHIVCNDCNPPPGSGQPATAVCGWTWVAKGYALRGDPLCVVCIEMDKGTCPWCGAQWW